MDYLREVERRQRAALVQLLTGAPSVEEFVMEAEQTNIRDGVSEERGREFVSRPTGESAERTAAEQGVEKENAQSIWPRETMAMPGGQAETFYQTRQADTFWRGGGNLSGSLPGLLLAERAMAAEVEDISRAVQRDARRYDGGFSIY